MEGLSYSSVVTPDLPSIRVSKDPPFSHTGSYRLCWSLVYIYAYSKNSDTTKVDKAYIIMCIHVYFSKSCALGHGVLWWILLSFFQCFAACQGLLAILILDNAKTFKISSREVIKIARSSDGICHLKNHRISWRFIVKRAPRCRGFWERLIHSIKRCLKCIGWANLTYEELSTLIVEVKCIIND